MKGKKGIALELVQERGECKCRRSSSVRRSFTSRLFVLLLLAVVVGTVCGLSRLDAASTIFSAFTIGFCTVPFLKRGGGLKQQELGEPGSLEGEKGTTLLDFKLEDDFVELFNALDRGTESQVWTTSEARSEWERKAHSYAEQLGGIAAGAQEVAARLKAAAGRVHAYAEFEASPVFKETTCGTGLGIVGTGDSAGTDGMSTRCNVLFEHFVLRTEDAVSCESVLNLVDNSFSPQDVLVAGFKELQHAVSQTAEKLRSREPGPVVQEEAAAEVALEGCEIAVPAPTTCGMARESAEVQDKDVDSGAGTGHAAKEPLYQATELSGVENPGQETVDMTHSDRQLPESALGDSRVAREENSEVANLPDSMFEVEEHLAQSDKGWSAGNEVFADLFEPIASEEASFRAGGVQLTSSRAGVLGDEACLAQGKVAPKLGLHRRSANIGSWADNECMSLREDDFSHRTGDEATEHVSLAASELSYRTAWTDGSLLAEDAGSTDDVSPDARVSRKTASFRETATEHYSATRDYAKTSKHRATKSDGEFLFMDGSASERENVSSVMGSPTGYGTSRVRDPKLGIEGPSPQMSTRRPNRGIASRLKGALTPRRFSSSRVVPGRDDMLNSNSSSRKGDKPTTGAPKRDDVLKANRIPSAEASSKVDANSKIVGKTTRRRLLS